MIVIPIHLRSRYLFALGLEIVWTPFNSIIVALTGAVCCVLILVVVGIYASTKCSGELVTTGTEVRPGVPATYPVLPVGILVPAPSYERTTISRYQVQVLVGGSVHAELCLCSVDAIEDLHCSSH